MKRKWLWIPLIVVSGLVAIPLLGGLVMASRRDFVVTTHINQPPEVLYQTTIDFAQWPSWYAPAKSSARIADQNGHAVWTLDMGWGIIVNEVFELKPPTSGQPGHVLTGVADPKAPVQGSWEWTFTPASGGTDVSLTDHGRITNPLLRFMLWRIMGPSMTIVPAVEGLAKKYGEHPPITVIARDAQ